MTAITLIYDLYQRGDIGLVNIFLQGWIKNWHLKDCS